LEGVVTRWLSMRGYGFIKAEDLDKDVFVHYTSLKNARDLKEGDKVRFEIQEEDRGPKAVEVEVL